LYFGNRRYVYVEEINNYHNLKPCTVSGMMTNMLVLNNNWSIARRRKKTSALVASDHKENNRYIWSAYMFAILNVSSNTFSKSTRRISYLY
jgi:hypothetical protein